MKRQFYVNYQIASDAKNKTAIISANSDNEAISLFYKGVPKNKLVVISSVIDTENGSQTYDTN